MVILGYCIVPTLGNQITLCRLHPPDGFAGTVLYTEQDEGEINEDPGMYSWN